MLPFGRQACLYVCHRQHVGIEYFRIKGVRHGELLFTRRGGHVVSRTVVEGVHWLIDPSGVCLGAISVEALHTSTRLWAGQERNRSTNRLSPRNTASPA